MTFINIVSTTDKIFTLLLIDNPIDNTTDDTQTLTSLLFVISKGEFESHRRKFTQIFV
jgi:hypothetical protein